MTDTKVYHTVATVARYFGIGKGMVYELCATGKLGHIRHGKKTIRISDDDIRMFEKKNHILPLREKTF